MNKSILVIGATGKQGFATVQQLLADGFKVRALTRNKNNEKLIALNHPNLEIFEGQLSDSTALEQAMDGQYGVYSIQPVLENVADELTQGKNIIDAAVAKGIQYYVCSTAGGVNRNRTSPHFEVLGKIEDYLSTSGLSYSIIKPSFFMDNFLRIAKIEDHTIKIPEFITPTIPFAMISSVDIAKIASNLFIQPEKYNGQSYEIASDECTLNEVVQTFSEVMQMPAKIEGEFISQTAERAWLEDYGYEVDFDLMDDINPQRLTLANWIQQYFKERK